MDLLPDLLDVVRRLRVRVRAVVEPVEVLGSVLLRRDEVVEVEPELLGEVLDLEVPGVDQLAAVLADLALVEHAADRPAAPAEPARGLMHLCVDSRLAQPVGSGQPGEPGANDDDARSRAAARSGARDRRAEQPAGEAGRAQAPAPRRKSRRVVPSGAAPVSAAPISAAICWSADSSGVRAMVIPFAVYVACGGTLRRTGAP